MCTAAGVDLLVILLTIGALIIIMGLWGILYYTYNKEPTKIVYVTFEAPIL